MALIDSFIIWIHLLATSIWVGGSIFIIVVGLSLKSLNMDIKERVRFMITLGKRFNKIALPALLILFATGIYNARLYIQYPENISSIYGIILSIKVALVIAMTIAYIIHVRTLSNEFDEYDDTRLNRVRAKMINIGRLSVILSLIILLLASILDSGL